MQLKTSLKTYEAAITINLVFALMNILGLIPDVVMPGEPQTDEEYDAKIRLIYIFFTVKFNMPYVLIGYYWWKQNKTITDVVDWAYLVLILVTGIKDFVDAIINPWEPTDGDWRWFFVVWALLTAVKIAPLMRKLKKPSI